MKLPCVNFVVEECKPITNIFLQKTGIHLYKIWHQTIFQYCFYYREWKNILASNFFCSHAEA